METDGPDYSQEVTYKNLLYFASEPSDSLTSASPLAEGDFLLIVSPGVSSGVALGMAA